MPHIIVKLWSGQSEDQKRRLAEESVSVGMEEVKSQDRIAEVYKPDIKERWDQLYKKPGYDPLE